MRWPLGRKPVTDVRPPVDEIRRELAALQALAQLPSTSQGERVWINGAIFTLSWAMGEPGSASPTAGLMIARAHRQQGLEA
jgi:hypothetical protein